MGGWSILSLGSCQEKLQKKKKTLLELSSFLRAKALHCKDVKYISKL